MITSPRHRLAILIVARFPPRLSRYIERFGVVETGRRRRWTDDEKLKIVLESLQAPRAVSSTARRYGISRSLLLTWRRSFGTRTSNTEQPQPAFVPTMVMPDQPPAPPVILAGPASGRMEIVVGKACRVIVDAGVDMTALSRVLDLLERR
ncbi:transposase [Bradyrhizobium sp. Leaf401]|uniref:IS66-like element accessory protein TnpA n=1 Tax=Bradyrhizobium sp. Leaf401 TaxID=2876564 RepID=UPI001E4F94E8|nr:transposase [Bradyrhizobium sp. Leaf401]